MKLTAKIVSWLTIPLLTPMYALLVVFFVPGQSKSMRLLDALYFYPWEAKALFLLLFLVFIFVAPGMSLLVLKVNRSISSVEVPNQYERETPILIMAFYSLVLYLFLLYQSDTNVVPSLILAMALGGLIASVIAFFLNKILKVSLHGIGLGALIGFLFAYFLTLQDFELNILIFSIILAGIGLSSRLYLKQHNLIEILVGFSLGFVSQFFSIYFYP